MLQGKSSPRNSQAVRLVVVHTAEGARDAVGLQNYFQRDGIDSSSHVAIDDAQILQMVPYDRAAWTLRSGNPISDNAELCGFASWSREEWLRHDEMLRLTARWIAERCAARGIPCVKITAADVRAGRSGVIGHIDWTNGMKDGSHWDPGPNFPWDIVMSLAGTNKEEDDMTPEQDARLARIEGMLAVPGQPFGYPAALNDKLDVLAPLVKDTQNRVRGTAPEGDMLQLIYALCLNLTTGPEVDVSVLAEKLRAGLGDEVAKSLGERLSK